MNYESVYQTTIEMLGINYHDNIYFFERAAVEIVTARGRYWIVVVDLVTSDPARCIVLRRPVADWELLIGLEAPDVLKVPQR